MNAYHVVISYKDKEYNIMAKTGAEAKKIAIKRALKRKAVIDRSTNGSYWT